MSKMNVANYIIENINCRFSGDNLELRTKENIISGIIEAWDNKKYLVPLPVFETNRHRSITPRIGRTLN